MPLHKRVFSGSWLFLVCQKHHDRPSLHAVRRLFTPPSTLRCHAVWSLASSPGPERTPNDVGDVSDGRRFGGDGSIPGCGSSHTLRHREQKPKVTAECNGKQAILMHVLWVNNAPVLVGWQAPCEVMTRSGPDANILSNGRRGMVQFNLGISEMMGPKLLSAVPKSQPLRSTSQG